MIEFIFGAVVGIVVTAVVAHYYPEWFNKSVSDAFKAIENKDSNSNI